MEHFITFINNVLTGGENTVLAINKSHSGLVYLTYIWCFCWQNLHSRETMKHTAGWISEVWERRETVFPISI